MQQCLDHAQTTQTLSKMNEVRLFGKVRSRGTTIMLNTFPFESFIMMNFEVEVWKFKLVKKKLSVKPYVQLFHLG